jgi:D-alanyl-D-alanine dipeptidase
VPIESPQLANKSPKEAATPSDASPIATSDAEAHNAPAAADLVDLRSFLPKVTLDMRYAGTNNFVGKAIYPKARCLVRRPVALALQEVQEALEKRKLQILLWDCYRPFSVQEEFWKLVPDARYVAKPLRKQGKLFKGSKHNRGAAVDLTLATLAGTPLPMPTDHDDFSPLAHVGAAGVPKTARKNAELLRRSMQAAGFTGIATEWWHFDHKSWQHYALSDEAL